MDAATVKNLVSLLFAVGMFVLMMRLGCGAHMMRGRHHGHSDGHGKDGANGDGKDPVCGCR